MAASLISFAGRSNAASKSNPTQPLPRLCGSAAMRPCSTGPGYPMVTTSYCQPAAASFTFATIFAAVSFGPDGNLIGSLSPVARILTWLPPTSMTRSRGSGLRSRMVLRLCRAIERRDVHGERVIERTLARLRRASLGGERGGREQREQPLGAAMELRRNAHAFVSRRDLGHLRSEALGRRGQERHARA